MNRLLPIILFIGWLGFGGYYYVCKIKNACGNSAVEQTEADSTSAEVLPMQFAMNSPDPVLSDHFDSIRGEIIHKLNMGDTLVIIGKYLDSEDGGESLGMERAGNVQALFVDYVDESNELMAESRLESHPSERQDLFDAIDFSIRAYGEEPELAKESDTEDSSEDQDWTDSNESTDEGESDNTMPSNSGNSPISEATVLHFLPESVKKDWTPSMKQALNQLVEEMKTNSNLKAYVTGYADEMPTSEENYQLGRKRAWAVKKKMWDAGIEPTRIVTSAYKSDETTSTSDVFMSKAVVRLK